MSGTSVSTELPATFGKYQLLRRIATGGMAEVFLARSFGVEGFEKRLVIKRILPALAQNPRFVSMFVNEAKISVCLNHPNIVQVYDLGRTDEGGGDWFIAMEHIHGRDLTQIVRTLRREDRLLPLPLAVYVVGAALRGLSYAHARTGADGQPLGLVHRDVSPHNLLVSFQGDVKLVDFGIARLAGVAESQGTSKPGGGKFAYMSPEQAKGDPVDRRADVFSAGIVLYELLVGHRLYDDPDPAKKLERVRKAEIPDPRLENPNIPDALWEILQKALARDPEDRYPSAETFEEDLRAFLYEQGLRADAGRMVEFLEEIYAAEMEQDPAADDLHRLAEDFARLQAGRTRTGDGSSMEAASQSSREALTGPGSGSDEVLPFGGRAREELKPVAVLIAEICGHTDLPGLLDPSALVERQREVLSSVRRTVRRFGGRLEAGADDAVQVIFGVPRTHEDDIDRALACALALCESARRLRARGIPVEICAGVHHGELTVERSREDERLFGRGDTFKLARRMCASADPGEVRASERVVSIAGERFQFAPGAAVSLRKGRTRNTWILRGRRRAGSEAAGGRWIVRGDELEVLRRSIVALGEGKGAVVVVRGEAGVGKSRLLQEVQELAKRRNLPRFRVLAAPFGTDRPLEPFRDLVATIVGVDQDAPATVRKKLARLTQLGLSEADVAVLAGLFALESLNPAVPAREILFEATRRLFRGLVAEGPAIVLFEDIQNLDALERGLLAHCASVASEGPLLLLCATRGQLHAGLRSAGVTEIPLGRLTDQGVAQLLSDHFDAPAVAPSLLEIVIRSAEGNPLYAQEVVKALEVANRVRIEMGTAVLVGGEAEFEIPPSVEGLVGTRIDALDPASKGILQVAATVGMAAPVALLRESTGIVGIEAIVDDLVEHALLRRDGERESATVEFPSRVIWEVARKGILGVQRRDYHRMVAEGMGRFYADHLEPHLETMAGHHAAGGQWLLAAQSTLRAGDIHHRGHYLDQALACYQIGVAWLEHVPKPQQTEGEAVFHRRIGALLRLLARWSEAERHLQLALDAAEEAGYGDEEAHVYLEMGRVFLATDRFEEAKALLEEALSLSTAYDYEDIEAEAVVARADLAVGQADFDLAEQLFQRVLDGAANTPGLAAHALLGLASRAIHQGEESRALRLLLRARELASMAGDRIVLGRIENNMGLVHFLGDNYAQALECFRTALEVRQGIGYRRGVVINLHNIGDAHFHLGDNARAFAAFDRSRQLAEEINWDVGIVMNDVFLGYLNAIRGENSGVELLSAALEQARRSADHSVLAIGHWLYGRYNRSRGDEPAATQHFQRGLDAARVFGDQYLIKLIEAAH